MWDALCKEIKEQSCTSFHGHDRNVSHGGESLAIQGTEFGPWFFTSHPRSFLLQSMWRTLWSPLWCKSSHVAEQPAPTHQPSTSLFESPLCDCMTMIYHISLLILLTLLGHSRTLNCYQETGLNMFHLFQVLPHLKVFCGLLPRLKVFCGLGLLVH